jgi:hypothetical protein
MFRRTARRRYALPTTSRLVLAATLKSMRMTSAKRCGTVMRVGVHDDGHC